MTNLKHFTRSIGMHGTKAHVEAFTGTLEEQSLAYATDTLEIGLYTNGAWVWIGSGKELLVGDNDDILFDDNGDIIYEE